MKISVLIVTAGRVRDLKKLLQSLINSEGFSETEIHILVNGFCPGSVSLVREFQDKHKNIVLRQSDRKNRCRARNILLQKAGGDVLYFLDDDVVVPDNIFNVLREAIKDYPGIDVFGGPNLTPEESTMFQRAQGFVLGSFFGTLWMSRRYRQTGYPSPANERTLILCNLAVKREAFTDKKMLFNEKLLSAEENVLLQKMAAKGARAMHFPGLAVYHERRKNYMQFLRQIFVYGRGRGQAVKCLWRTDNLVYFIPSGFVLYLLVGLAVGSTRYFFAAYVYALIVLVNAAALTIKHRRVRLLPMLMVLFPLVHLAYGTGFFVESLINKKTGTIFPNKIKTFDFRFSRKIQREAAGINR